MEWSWRRHRPLETLSIFPNGCSSFLATFNAFENDEQENELGQTETEGTDCRDHIEVSKLQWVVRITTWHPGQAEEVHREEGDVEGDHRRPEVELA